LDQASDLRRPLFKRADARDRQEGVGEHRACDAAVPTRPAAPRDRDHLFERRRRRARHEKVGDFGPIGDASPGEVFAGMTLAPHVSDRMIESGGSLGERTLRRAWPTPITQPRVTPMPNQVLARVLPPSKPRGVPWNVRVILCLPIHPDAPSRWIASGIWPVHVKE
jgi:hypothetical protein